jgi:tripartite-type tricarboxylate transporter receptor subunit TctC
MHLRFTTMSKHLTLAAVAAAALTATSVHAQQGDYPNKPVKVVVTVPAGGGVDTVTRLVTERLRQKLGQPFVIENKGIVAGHVDMIFMQYEAAIKLHEGGKARILAVTTEKRLPSLPDIPTMAEAGLKDFISDTWNAISAPPKTPAPIIAILNSAVNEILKMPDVQEQYRRLGLQAGGGSPEDMAKVVKDDTTRWSAVIREAKIPQI